MTVTVSTWLLWLTALVFVVSAVITFAYLGARSDVYEQTYAGTSQEGDEGAAVATEIGIGVVFLLFAAGLVILGLLNNRGKNPARIVTWVVGGLALCCTGSLLALTGLLSGVEVEGGVDPEELADNLIDAMPGWYAAFELISSIVPVLALIVALVLLALPPSNEFFRKPPQDVFEPPPNDPPPPPPAGGATSSELPPSGPPPGPPPPPPAA
jgi:hypothetical protein